MNNGGPAFPFYNEKQVFDTISEFHLEYLGSDGMSLRDWFAGEALQGELACQNAESGEWPEGHESGLAKRCYKIADAMLEERDKGGAT